jgi:predicted DCC family thiol-disulfide oxidoreductase YuxK
VTRPRLCGRCGVNPVGYSGRACCYTCVPRRRRAPLACKRCGSGDFFTAGLCRRCHRSSRLVDSCRDCLAWGVTRHEKWLCQACRGWRRRYTEAVCPSCRRVGVVNDRGFCRLCCRQATVLNRLNPAHRVLDVTAQNAHGHQLFFADMILKKRGKQPATTGTSRLVLWPAGYPVEHRQLALFDPPQRLTNDVILRLTEPIPALAAALQRAVRDHGDRHGWSKAQRDGTWRGIRVLLALQATPGARITRTEADILMLVENTTVQPVVEVLASVDMLDDDRQPPLEQWFTGHVTDLPTAMRHELTEWFHARRDGTTTTPRMRPRHIDTVRNNVLVVLPLVRGWAESGHQSLREISRDDVVAALATTPRRTATLSPLRSLFRYLKARKITFINPTAHIRGDRIQPTQPLPIDLDVVRDALHSPDAVRAALAALFAFHALRTGQARHLLLTDVRDGRLHVDGNIIVLADPVRDRLNTWLAERARRWPNTSNPHLFITSRTAVRTTPVTSVWIGDKLGIRPQKIREDRILNEAIATDGDVRRLADLFGISVGTAQRYVDVIAKPHELALVADTASIGSRTQGAN